MCMECKRKLKTTSISVDSLFVFSLLSSLNDLLLEDRWLAESKSNLVGGELVIDVLDGSESVLHHFEIKWIKKNFVVFSSVVGDSGSFTSDA